MPEGDATRSSRPPLLQRLRDTPVVRQGAWVAATQLLSIAGRLVGLRLLTELLSPSVFAEVVLLGGLALLGNHILCAPILHATLRFLPEARNAGRIADFRRLLVGMLGRRYAITAAMLLVGGALWIGLTETETRFVTFVLLCAVLLVDVQHAFEANQLNATRRQAAFGLWAASDAWLRMMAAVGGVLLFGPSAASVLLGYFVGGAVVNVIFRRLVVRVPGDPLAADPSWTTRLRRDILRFANPLIPQAVLGWVINMSDRYILAELAGAESAGIYSATYGIANQPFVVVANIVSNTLRPVLFDAASTADRSKERRTLLTWVGISGAIFAGGLVAVYLLSELLAGLLLGEAFRGGSDLFIWIGAAYAVRGIEDAFSNTILAHRRTERLLVVQIAGASSALVLYFLLIPSYGAKGAAIATLGSMTAACLTSMALSGAFARRRPDPGEEPG